MENNGCCPVKSAPISKSSGSCDTGEKKPCCWGTMFKGALIGGVVMFLYFWASWMLLPWHKNTIMSFGNEAMVATTLATNAQKSGIYILPAMKPAPQGTEVPATGKKAPVLPTVDKPFAFVSVFTNGIQAKDMNATLIKEFLLCLFSALLLTCFLKKATCCGQGCPVLTSFKIGLLVALIDHVPNLIWFKFPLNFTLVGMADDVIAFTLAGLLISKCLMRKSGSCGTK